MTSRRRCSSISPTAPMPWPPADLPALIRVVPGRPRAGPRAAPRPRRSDRRPRRADRTSRHAGRRTACPGPQPPPRRTSDRPHPGGSSTSSAPRGTSVTLLPGTGAGGCGSIGPTDAPLIGRVPEACRRQLGLPTPAPPPIEVTTIVDLWLTRLTAAAVRGDAARWTDAVALLPGAPGQTTTPGDTARALHRAAVALELGAAAMRGGGRVDRPGRRMRRRRHGGLDGRRACSPAGSSASSPRRRSCSRSSTPRRARPPPIASGRPATSQRTSEGAEPDAESDACHDRRVRLEP